MASSTPTNELQAEDANTQTGVVAGTQTHASPEEVAVQLA